MKLTGDVPEDEKRRARMNITEEALNIITSEPKCPYTNEMCKMCIKCDINKEEQEWALEDRPHGEPSEPKCKANGTPFDECGRCEHFKCDTGKCEADPLGSVIRADIISALIRMTDSAADSLLLTGAIMRCLANDRERHEQDRKRAKELREHVLAYIAGTSADRPADCRYDWEKAPEQCGRLQDGAECLEPEQKKEAVQTGKWIPCSDRLPEVGQNVLVSYDDEADPIGIIQGARPHLWTTNNYMPVAWMPLPEPYKKGTGK